MVLGITLAACNSSDQTKEEIYNHLEEAVKKEKDFHEAQKDLVEVEKEESKLSSQLFFLDCGQCGKLPIIFATLIPHHDSLYLSLKANIHPFSLSGYSWKFCYSSEKGNC